MPYSIGNYVRKNLSTTGGFLRAAALLGLAGAFAGGVILQQGVSRPNPSANTSLNDTHIAANFLAKELTSGCVAAGTGTGCVQVISGVTQNGYIFTHTGGLIVGSFASPTIVLSGALVRIGGGYPAAGVELSVVGDMSGSTLQIDQFGAAPTFKVLCPKTAGRIGTMTVTATGTVLKTCN